MNSERQRPGRIERQEPLADVFNALITSLSDGRQLSPADNARVTRIYTELSRLDEKRSNR